MTFDLPGLLILAQIRNWMGAGMLPGGDESMAMMLLMLSTVPACVFWALIGLTIGWMIRMAKV
jgi:predicted cobalt transporter CbtA